MFARLPQAMTRVAAQSEADRARIAQLYTGPIEVLGNLKFDLAPPSELVDQGRSMRAALGPRPVWLFAAHATAKRRSCSMRSSRCVKNWGLTHFVGCAAASAAVRRGRAPDRGARVCLCAAQRRVRSRRRGEWNHPARRFDGEIGDVLRSRRSGTHRRQLLPFGRAKT